MQAFTYLFINWWNQFKWWKRYTATIQNLCSIYIDICTWLWWPTEACFHTWLVGPHTVSTYIWSSGFTLLMMWFGIKQRHGYSDLLPKSLEDQRGSRKENPLQTHYEVKTACTSQIWCVVRLPSWIVLGSHFSAHQLLLSTMAVKSVLCWWCGQSGLMMHVDGRQVIQLNKLAKAGCKCQLYELLFVSFLKVAKVVLPNQWAVQILIIP